MGTDVLQQARGPVEHSLLESKSGNTVKSDDKRTSELNSNRKSLLQRLSGFKLGVMKPPAFPSSPQEDKPHGQTDLLSSNLITSRDSAETRRSSRRISSRRVSKLDENADFETNANVKEGESSTLDGDASAQSILIQVGDQSHIPFDIRRKAAETFEFDMSEEESEKVAVIRGLIADMAVDEPGAEWIKSTKDWELVRFLRGHKTSIKETWVYLHKTGIWRANIDIEAIVQNHLVALKACKPEEGLLAHKTSPEFMVNYFPSKILGVNQGRPVSLYRLAMADFVGLLKESSLESITENNIFSLEMAWSCFPQGSGILIMDLGYNDKEPNTPIQSLWDVRSYVNAILTVTKHVAAQVDPSYPESFSKIFFVRPPSNVFKAAWKVAQYFVAERTRSKINILGNTLKSFKPLHDAVPLELLPPFLGGTNTKPFPVGGRLSPKCSA